MKTMQIRAPNAIKWAREHIIKFVEIGIGAPSICRHTDYQDIANNEGVWESYNDKRRWGCKGVMPKLKDIFIYTSFNSIHSLS